MADLIILRLAVVASLALPAGAAEAQSSRQVDVPEGCEAFLTVQSRGCTVRHYWSCSADPDGTFWTMSMDLDGPFYLNQTDSEFRWLRSFDLRSDSESVLIEPEEDPASMTELLATGEDQLVFSTRRQEAGISFERNYAGFDRLTGETVVIDGETLLVTEFAYEYPDGGGVLRVEGSQYVNPERRLFFGGFETVTLPTGEQFDGDRSPVEFLDPGEAGFLSPVPLYDCGAIARLHLPEAQRGG